MNKQKLKIAEARFMQRYPGGFSHPDMQAIGKKHRVTQMVALAQEAFAKPRFRDSVRVMSRSEKELLTTGLEEFLHGKQPAGFDLMTEALRQWKLAKWSLLTVIPNYYRPRDEVFVKPTTAKGVIDHFELKGLVYSAQPSWDFYQRFRDEIRNMKACADPSLSPSNAAFLGFLMMSFQAAKAEE